MSNARDIIIGIDAGTSVIKAVAFDTAGTQISVSSIRNSYHLGADGSATQSQTQTWDDCAAALRGLCEQVDALPERCAAVAVTGQGDGTWLIDSEGTPLCDAWLWLDARAAPTVQQLLSGSDERARFRSTGTGLNTCQQGSQLAHMHLHHPRLLDSAATALHCKDWLFYNLTGIVATDPSEASFTFGDFRRREYSDTVIAALGLETRRGLLPGILDGSKTPMPLNSSAARVTGLLAGTPVILGYVDMVMTALGAGVHTDTAGNGCSVIGSTGVHMRACPASDVHFNDAGTGYVICLPIENLVTQVQSNMAATLNIDWLLSMAAELVTDGRNSHPSLLVDRIDGWLSRSRPGELLYHPYISEAGERGPFVDAAARASFIGLNSSHRFADLVRAVIEGLGMATRDCYHAMGDMPTEIRLSGGAARSRELRRILAAACNTGLRISSREEAGAAGAAMMAAVAIGAYSNMTDCIAEWTTPLLGTVEPPDQNLVPVYNQLFEHYHSARTALQPVWHEMNRGGNNRDYCA